MRRGRDARGDGSAACFPDGLPSTRLPPPASRRWHGAGSLPSLRGRMNTPSSWVALAACLALGSGVSALADAPEMFGCAVEGRLAAVKEDGSVVQERPPDETARLYVEHCDFVALGRFPAITAAEYDRETPATVVALFRPEEVLLGPQLAAARVRIAGDMLVEPGEAVSRATAEGVHRSDRLIQVRMHDAIVQDLRRLRGRSEAGTSGDLLGAMEENLRRLFYPRLARKIDRRTTAAHGGGGRPSRGTTFHQEGGAVQRNRTFLLGLDMNEGAEFDHLGATYTLVHWGDYADEVAHAIRARRPHAAR